MTHAEIVNILNVGLVGMGGVLVWLFKLLISRHLAILDAEKTAREQRLRDIEIEIAELRGEEHSRGAAAGEANGLDKQPDARSGHRGRLHKP